MNVKYLTRNLDSLNFRAVDLLESLSKFRGLFSTRKIESFQYFCVIFPQIEWK